jgi:ring-1,2-phenylacetyl-CoA epoxidase subunit PaaE
LSTHFHKLKVKDIRIETADCRSIAFDIPESLKNEFRFIHGQNITLRITVNNEEIRRSYSICSSPFENELRIAVKKITNGKFSTCLDSLQKDSWLEILSPTGKFHTQLSPGNKKNYVALAAGSGITPVISIIKTTLETEKESSFTLIYGNKNRSSIIFKEELEAIKNRHMSRFALHHILSREKTDAEINYGRITAHKCDQLNNRLVDFKKIDEFFICGPELMITEVKEWLEKKEIDSKRIHFELFNVPGQAMSTGLSKIEPPKDKVEGKISSITIKQDGVSFNFDLAYNAESILDAAIGQGVDLPFSCKGGVCSTCRAKLIEGKIEMAHNYALEPDELEMGFILTCQSHPRSQLVSIDFDIK